MLSNRSVISGALLFAVTLGFVSAAFAQQTKSNPAKPATAQAQAKPTAAPAGDSQPTLLGQYGDWGAYTATPGGKKVCFTLAKPKTSSTNPPGRARDQSYIFISTRPAENVKNEISVIIGYPFKPSSDASAEVEADQVRRCYHPER